VAPRSCGRPKNSYRRIFRSGSSSLALGLGHRDDRLMNKMPSARFITPFDRSTDDEILEPIYVYSTSTSFHARSQSGAVHLFHPSVRSYSVSYQHSALGISIKIWKNDVKTLGLARLSPPF
jgi:hypothetical protein